MQIITNQYVTICILTQQKINFLRAILTIKVKNNLKLHIKNYYLK